MKIGDRLSGVERRDSFGDRNVRARRHFVGVPDFGDVFDPTFLLGHDHSKGNAITRLKSAQLVGVLYVERHRHLLHVARDVFVLNDNRFFRGLYLFDDTADREAFLS